MSWMQFFMYCAIGYIIYYAVAIGLDVLKGGGSNSPGESEDVLHFSEDIQTKVLKSDSDNQNTAITGITPSQEPVRVVTEDLAPPIKIAPVPEVKKIEKETAIEGMGVSIKGLMDLAKQGSIEFTKPVSFQ